MITLTARATSVCDACDHMIRPGDTCVVFEGLVIHAACGPHAEPDYLPAHREPRRRRTPRGHRR